MIIDKTPKGKYINNHHEYVCDFLSDVENLPTAVTEPNKCDFGSTAMVIEDSSVWILNSSNVWVEF